MNRQPNFPWIKTRDLKGAILGHNLMACPIKIKMPVVTCYDP